MSGSRTRTVLPGRVSRWLITGVVSAALLIAWVGAAPTTAQDDAILAYAECMRDNGIEVTDPIFDTDGRLVGGLEFEGGKEAEDGEFLAASEACKDLPDAFGVKDAGCDNAADPDYRILAQGDESREYLLHVPEALSADTTAPLVVSFHGFGGCATDFASLVGDVHGLHELAEEERFLVAFPQGLERTKGGAEWDPGDDRSEDIMTNDLAFTEQLVQAIGEEHPVDTSRVYAAGYSNGGMMAYGLACSRSERITAAGIMSGVMLPDDCDTGRPTSIIHFHGAQDDVLPLEGNQDFQAVSSIVDFWLEQNSIPRDSLSANELKSGDVSRESYAGGEEDTAFALYTIRSEYGKPGGHVWFSEEIEGRTPTEILWDFLSEKRRQE